MVLHVKKVKDWNTLNRKYSASKKKMFLGALTRWIYHFRRHLKSVNASRKQMTSTRQIWKNNAQDWPEMTMKRAKSHYRKYFRKHLKNAHPEKFQLHVSTSTRQVALITSMNFSWILTTHSEVIMKKLQILLLTLNWLIKHMNMPVTFQLLLENSSIHRMKTDQTKVKTSTGNGHHETWI
jgi:hypothetical protein